MKPIKDAWLKCGRCGVWFTSLGDYLCSDCRRHVDQLLEDTRTT